MNNNPSVDQLVEEGLPTDIAVLIRPYLNRWASEIGDLARAIRQALAADPDVSG